MRKQIAAANWKMNLILQQGEALIDTIISKEQKLQPYQQVVFAVPALYIPMALQKISGKENIYVAAQNIYHKKSGAYTGEISAEMLQSIGVTHVVLGHSERREYFTESNKVLAEKINLALANNLTPIFCCGESLDIREEHKQNEFVSAQLEESLFHLSPGEIKKVVIAYEPIWAIGTGKTATTEQAQSMHEYLRHVFTDKYGTEVSYNLSILYGGSVKAANAHDIFAQPDVDGGLVGGSSLIADEFTTIINSLK